MVTPQTPVSLENKRLRSTHHRAVENSARNNADSEATTLYHQKRPDTKESYHRDTLYHEKTPYLEKMLYLGNML